MCTGFIILSGSLCSPLAFREIHQRLPRDDWGPISDEYVEARWVDAQQLCVYLQVVYRSRSRDFVYLTLRLKMSV